ncbi:MAG: hypothetical protein ACOYJU_03905 [Anaerovoracaceae bacterium]|jgi:hypothetical protein
MRFWSGEKKLKTRILIAFLAVAMVLGGTTSWAVDKERQEEPNGEGHTAPPAVEKEGEPAPVQLKEKETEQTISPAKKNDSEGAPIATPAPKTDKAEATAERGVPSTFTTSWREGGLNTATQKEGVITGDLLDITPKNNYSTRPAIYQLDFTMGGNRDAAPGEIEIRIPAHIFYGRDGKPVDTISVPLPKAPDTVGTTSFNYREDNETGEIVISNFEPFNRTDSFSVFIEHDFWPYQVKDGFTHPEIRTKVNIKTDGEDVTAQTDPLYVKVNTTASLSEVRKTLDRRTNKWEPAWGPKPDDADDHFYCVWRINLKSSSTSTQPFEIKMTDVGTPLGEVVAFSTPKVLHVLNTPPLGFNVNVKNPDGTDTFSNYVFQKTDDPKNNNSTEWRTFYVVTKYDKSLAVEGKQLKNTITADLTGVDGAKSTLSKSATYTYKPDATYSGDASYGYKVAASSVRSEGALNALDNDDEVDLLGLDNHSFRLKANVTGKDVSQDGEKDYTVELVDGVMGMRQDVKEGDKPWFSLLKAGTDYEYLKAYVLYNEYDYT